MMRRNRIPLLAGALGLCWCITAYASDAPRIQAQPASAGQAHDATDLKGAADKACPWGEPVDGITCRVVVQPRYVVGQAITAAIELKNVSKKKRYIIRSFHPVATEHTSISISGPQGELRQSTWAGGARLWKNSFESVEAGKIKRLEMFDLRSYFLDLHPSYNRREVRTGKYSLRFRFKSPAIPTRLIDYTVPGEAGQPGERGQESIVYEKTPPEMLAGQWAHEVVSAPVAFDLLPLTKNDLVVHEWGVFTLFNDAKYADTYRKKEWGSLPSFFYRQFPKEHFHWHPAIVTKPVVYSY